jgi:hypothetical protein
MKYESPQENHDEEVGCGLDPCKNLAVHFYQKKSDERSFLCVCEKHNLRHFKEDGQYNKVDREIFICAGVMES